MVLGRFDHGTESKAGQSHNELVHRELAHGVLAEAAVNLGGCEHPPLIEATSLAFLFQKSFFQLATVARALKRLRDIKQISDEKADAD